MITEEDTAHTQFTIWNKVIYHHRSTVYLRPVLSYFYFISLISYFEEAPRQAPDCTSTCSIFEYVSRPNMLQNGSKST